MTQKVKQIRTKATQRDLGQWVYLYNLLNKLRGYTLAHPFGHSKTYCELISRIDKYAMRYAKRVSNEHNNDLFDKLGRFLSLLPIIRGRDRSTRFLHRVITPLNRQEDLTRLHDSLMDVRKVLRKQGIPFSYDEKGELAEINSNSTEQGGHLNGRKAH